MKIPTLLCALLSCTLATAQHALITGHDWDERPTVPDTVLKMTETEVILRRHHVTQVVDEGPNVVGYDMFHYQCYLRDAKAIEENNTMQIGLSDVAEVVSVKARTIGPDGRVVELGKDAFKQAIDEEQHESYMYFAYEGLVPGSVIEYISVLKKEPEMRGKRETLQFNVPVMNGSFDLIAPERLVFAMKTYNGAPAPAMDSSDTGLQHFHVELHNVPALKSEPSAAVAAHRMQLVYKLDKVTDRDLKDVSGFVTATKIYHAVLYPELTPRTQKALDKLVKEMRLSFARNDEDRVRTLENHIKTHFALLEAGPEAGKLENVLEQHAGNKLGITVLFCNVFRTIGLEHEVVVNNDRSVQAFDGDFGSHVDLQNIFIHVPSLGRYLAPTEFGMRFGWIPATNMDNDALFIRNYDIGGALTGVGKVRHINALPDSLNAHDTYATVTLGADASSALIELENHLTGYYATDLQVIYSRLNDDVKEKVQNDLLGFLLENSTSQEVHVENGEAEYMGVRPFVLKAKVNSAKFSGSAGDKVFFNIGELIGPQMELYTENERKLPVDDDYNRRFHREITVTLPEGYTLQNADALNMDQHLDMDGKRVIFFQSNYTLNGRELKVLIDERYARCKLPVEQYEPYRKVVNAAADFNKVKLVLVKG